MNTRDLCTLLASRMDIPRSEAMWAFREIVALMEDLLLDGEEIRLPRLGKLIIVERGGYWMKDNLRGGRPRYVKRYKYVEFKHYESHIRKMSAYQQQQQESDPAESMEEAIKNEEEEY